MRVYCKRCGVMYYVDDSIKLKRRKNGDIIKHCQICSNEEFEVEGL